MASATELRARAADLEARVPPVTAGPRTDDERMWLEKATALRAEADRLDGDRATIEINRQTFTEGDIVCFERAALPENRDRSYTITAVAPAGIEASACGFSYGFTTATAARIGITHAK